jgi:hypothetical protein
MKVDSDVSFGGRIAVLYFTGPLLYRLSLMVTPPVARYRADRPWRAYRLARIDTSPAGAGLSGLFLFFLPHSLAPRFFHRAAAESRPMAA